MRSGKRNYKRRGVAIVWVAIMGFTLIALLGLAIDASYSVLTAYQLQNAADAAALAGAQKVREDVVRSRDLTLGIGLANKAAGQPVELGRNDGNLPDGDVVVGNYDRDTGEFDPNATSLNAVKVVARRTEGSLGGPLPLLFGPLVGFDNIDVSRSAIAMIGGGTGAGIITLDPTSECTLKIDGNNDIIVASAPGYDGEASIQVDSNNECALCGSGSSLSIDAPETNIVGDACWKGNPTLDTDVNPNSPYVPDPLADKPPPPWDPADDLGSIRTTCSPSPGYYSGGIRITSTGVIVILEPGVYVLDGEGLYVNGGNLIAHEVMFYVIDSTPLDNKPSRVYLGGSGIIDITPSSNKADPYWGISIFQARDNTNESVIIGSSSMNLEGTYYFPVAPVEIGGTGIALGNQFIAWTLWMHGTGTFDIQYDGRYPAPGNKVFLVW